MYKKLIYLTFSMSALTLCEGQVWGAYRAAYWDGRYRTWWADEAITTAIRDDFEAAGYTILDADELKMWMDARIADRKASVVVFCRDNAPDTVIESASPNCTLRQYLDAGGKIVWYSDIPFWDQAHLGGGYTQWSGAGCAAILGIPGITWENDTNSQVVLTDDGVTWGLTETWRSNRWTPADDTFTVLATDAAGNAAAWVKHFVPGDTTRGFVRIWDTDVTPGYRPSFGDLLRVAEYGLGGDPFARGPNPPDGSQHAQIWANLSWLPGDFAVSHDVYLGDNFDDVNEATTDSDVFRGNTTEESLWVGFPDCPYPDGLSPGTTYYWRVDEVNDVNVASPWKGPVWSFWLAPETAYDPYPADGAKFQDPDVDLSWSPGWNAAMHYVYFGDDFDTVKNATGGRPRAATSYDPETLELEKVYYWRVDEVEQGGALHTGDVWSFTTIPIISITDLNLVAWWKLDEGEGTVVLDWSGREHHGTCLNGPQWVAGYDGDALDLDGSNDYVDFGNPPDLPSGTAPRSMCGWGKTDTVAGGWRWIAAYGSPGTSQAMFIGMNGTDLYGGGYDDDVLMTGYWEVGEWHHICLTYDGATARLYADGVQVDSAVKTWDLVLSRAHIGRQVNNLVEFWDGLVDDVRIYNKALTLDEIKQAMRGDPTLAWNPKPSRGALVDIEHATPLNWSPGERAVQHDVYFGTDPIAVADADTTTPVIYRGRCDVCRYTPTEAPLEWAKTYYWRIDEVNDAEPGSPWKGSLWSFTTANCLIVEDFEQYDDVCNQIFYTWTDGWGHEGDPGCGVPPAAGNGTGSTVGNLDPPTVEQTIVHGGRQSMPFGYNNAVTPFYSEAARQWASPQDWTRRDVRGLSLCFHGHPGNAPDTLYLVVEDSATNVAVVTHPDAEALQGAGWQQWNIALQQLGGVNLASIKKVYLGVGNRSSPQASGSGRLYFDDIRVYPARCVPSLAKPVADLSGNCIVDYADVQIVASQWLNDEFMVTPVDPGTAGLVAHYPFEGDANDAIGDHNGVTSDIVTYGAGKVGQAIILDGVNDYVIVGSVGIGGDAPRTISGWAKAHATVMPDWTNIFGFTDPGGGAAKSFDIEYTGVTGATYRGYGIHVYGWERNICPVDLDWHHLAATYDEITVRWYGDGRLVGSSDLPLDTVDNLQMGKRADYENYFPGRIDEVCIFSRALSEAEIAWLAGHTSPLSIPTDLHQDDVIDFKDLAVLADAWLQERLWP